MAAVIVKADLFEIQKLKTIFGKMLALGKSILQPLKATQNKKVGPYTAKPNKAIATSTTVKKENYQANVLLSQSSKG